jgi:hypothetical protein
MTGWIKIEKNIDGHVLIYPNICMEWQRKPQRNFNDDSSILDWIVTWVHPDMNCYLLCHKFKKHILWKLHKFYLLEAEVEKKIE